MLQHGANTLQYGRLNVGPKVPGYDKGAYDTYVEYDENKKTDTKGSTSKNRFSHEF